MITSLSAVNFRNFSTLEFKLSPKINVLYGPNGIGKTNILESIYFLSTTNSFRAKDNLLIKHNCDFFKLNSEYDDKKNCEARLYIKNNLSKKEFYLNKVKNKQSDIIGIHPVVLFIPDDLNLFSGLSVNRRNLIDRILTQSDKLYFAALMRYRKIIRQRNSLLKLYKQQKIGKNELHDQLFLWDIQLVEPATYIILNRIKLIKGFLPIIKETYAQISQKNTQLNINYELTVKPEEILEKMKNNIIVDSKLGYTTLGPHRDDIAVEFGNFNISEVASRGETRTLILSIKMAELYFINSALSVQPILLLDDVFSELDKSRQDYLIRQLVDNQTIITTTHVDSKLNSDTNLINVSKLR